jgi:hypothetical protein
VGKVKEGQVVYRPKPRQGKKERARSLSPRKRVAAMLAGMKDSATYEDILYRVYVLYNLELGEKDIREGRVFSQEEVERMLDRWLK